MKGSRLRAQERRAGKLGRTHYEKAKQVVNPAHCSLLSAEVSSCLESICSQSPCLRSNSREVLNAPSHVRLVCEAKLNRDACEWRLSIPNRPECMASANARAKCLGRNSKHQSKTPRYSPRGNSIPFSPLGQFKRWIPGQSRSQLVRPVGRLRHLTQSNGEKQVYSIGAAFLRHAHN